MARRKKGSGTGLTIRLDPEARGKLDALAKKRGLTTGALLRSLGLDAAERDQAAERLMRRLEELDPDDGDDAR